MIFEKSKTSLRLVFFGANFIFYFIFSRFARKGLAASIFMLLRSSVLRTLATFGRNCLAASTFLCFFNFIFILFIFIFFFSPFGRKSGDGKGGKLKINLFYFLFYFLFSPFFGGGKGGKI